jgi:hypothetical protein
MQTPSEAGRDDEAGNRPPPAHLPAPEAGASRPAATPVAARRSIRQVTAAQIAARAPANFAMPMGTAQPAPHGDASSAAALRTEIARLAERPRALPAASAEGRVTHRIGTVQVVVRTPPPEPRRVAPASTQALPGGRAPAEPPAARPYRNPWASSRWRGD